MQKTSLTRSILDYCQLLILFIFFLFPIIWMVAAGFKHNVDITSYPPKLFSELTLDHFRDLFTLYPFQEYLINSIVISFGSTLLGLILGVPAAYAAARFNLQCTAFLTLIARMTPGVLFLIPWYVITSNLGITYNYFTLIATHNVITMPIIIWLMSSTFEELPPEIEEYALIDGCGPFRVMWKIAIPLALPGLSVATILSFIFSWNYFLFALVLAGNKTTPLTV